MVRDYSEILLYWLPSSLTTVQLPKSSGIALPSRTLALRAGKGRKYGNDKSSVEHCAKVSAILAKLTSVFATRPVETVAAATAATEELMHEVATDAAEAVRPNMLSTQSVTAITPAK